MKQLHQLQQQVFDIDGPSLDDELFDYSGYSKYHRTDQLQLDLTDDLFKNKNGFIRWKKIRAAYFNNVINEHRALDLYRKWRDQKECFAMDGFDVWGDYQLTAWGKAAKRGNDIYRMMLKQQFSVFDRLPSIDFVDIFQGHTPMLFITLTVDTKKYSLRDAWMSVQKHFHQFMASVYQEYGSNVFLKCWEAHKSGYPHIHLVLFCKKHMFRVRPMKRKDDGTVVFRVDDDDNDFFHRIWNMGSIVDVQGVSDTDHAFSEIQKYITKSIWSDKCDLTNAMICLFNKRQFSISKDFITSIWGKDALSKDGSDAELDLHDPRPTEFVTPTVYNCNKAYPNVVDFRFGGMFAGRDLHLILDLDRPPPDFSDPDYNVFQLFGMLDKRKLDGDDPLLSGSVVLDDDDIRFCLGLKPLDVVAAAKCSLLCDWFVLVDSIIELGYVMVCSVCGSVVGPFDLVGGGGYCPDCLVENMFRVV